MDIYNHIIGNKYHILSQNGGKKVTIIHNLLLNNQNHYSQNINHNTNYQNITIKI